MKYNAFIVTLSVLGVVSCSESETPDPAPHPQKRLMSITSEATSERFSYDTRGRVVGWVYDDSEYMSSYSADYNYFNDNCIDIRAEDIRGTGFGTSERWDFDEMLYLDSEGIAEYADGLARLQNDNYGEFMRKKYHCEFSYNSDRQLTLIEVSEWRTNADGWVEEVPLTYEIGLEWAGSLLVRVTEHNRESEYTYHYGDTGHTCMPLIGYAILRSYYMPLRYAGVFGRQSDCLLKQIRTTYFDGSVFELEYLSYSFSTASDMTYVTGYKTVSNGNRETEYKISWE